MKNDYTDLGYEPVDTSSYADLGYEPVTETAAPTPIPTSFLQRAKEAIIGGYQKAGEEIPQAIEEGARIQAEGKPVQGLLRSSLGTAAPAARATFSPIMGVNKLALEQAGLPTEGLGGAVLQGGAMGGELGGPIGAAVGALFGAGVYGIDQIKQKVYEIPQVQNYLAENPAQQKNVDDALELLYIVGGQRLARGRGGVLEEPVSKAIPEIGKNVYETAKVPIKATAYVVKGAPKLASALTQFGTSQSTGLTPETISEIIKNPDDFSPEVMKSYSREAVGKEALDAVSSRIEALSETGKEYQPIREAKSPVEIPKGTVETILSKHGIGVDKKGKLVFDKESTPTSPADRAGLQEWYDTYGKHSKQTSNSFLNARKGLDNLAQWDAAKTDAANILAGDLRRAWNDVGRKQVEGLEQTDAKFSTETEALKGVRKDYFNRDGTLKDGALNRIANLTGKGKVDVLGRLEKIQPGIGQKIRTMKAIEDIDAATGQKVGTYTRTGIGLVGGATLNAPMVLAAILSTPQVAIQILRGYGKVKGLSSATIDKIISAYQATEKAK